jgi:hypothetical protein
MLHHLSLGTSNLDRARAFYDPVMNALGLRRTLDVEEAVGYGAGITVFSLNMPADGEQATVGNGTHVAFEVENRAAVDALAACETMPLAASLPIVVSSMRMWSATSGRPSCTRGAPSAEQSHPKVATWSNQVRSATPV